MKEQLLNYDQVGERLGVTSRTIFTLRKRGELASINVGRRVLFAESEVQRWIDAQKAAVPMATAV